MCQLSAEGRKPTELAAVVGVGQPTVARLIDGLERQGLLARGEAAELEREETRMESERSRGDGG